MSGVTVKIKGPVFDGAPAETVRVALEEVTTLVAKQGAAIIKTRAAKFNKSGHHTGAAAASVTYRTSGTTAIVEGTSTRGKTWWPWLEGTSRRNAGNRFKGYHVFRLAANIMRKRMKAEAEKAVTDAVARLGGA